jgi:hypothetical protein
MKNPTIKNRVVPTLTNSWYCYILGTHMNKHTLLNNVMTMLCKQTKHLEQLEL